MNPTHTISYGLAQAHIASLQDQARRQSLARAARADQTGKARSGSQPRSSGVPGHVRLVHRRRVTTAIG